MQQVNLKHYYAVDYWQTFWRIYQLLQRRAELQSLIGWSSKKRLLKVEQAYALRLADDEQRLFRLSLHFPNLTNLARILIMVKRITTPSSHYYRPNISADS
jgi:hypothetical protein